MRSVNPINNVPTPMHSSTPIPSTTRPTRKFTHSCQRQRSCSRTRPRPRSNRCRAVRCHVQIQILVFFITLHLCAPVQQRITHAAHHSYECNANVIRTRRCMHGWSCFDDFVFGKAFILKMALLNIICLGPSNHSL